MNDLTLGWKSVAVIIEGEHLSLDGLNPWQLTWHKINSEPINVAHPSHTTQRHNAGIYELRESAQIVRFAACELSANVWGFYLPN